MKLLVSGSTKSVAKVLSQRPDRIGVLLTPSSGQAIPPDHVPYACDNDCFGGLKESAWLRLLAKLVNADHKPLWITCPDVVANMGATWSLYYRWAPILRSLGLPVALVLQDGLELLKWRAPLPSAWNDLAAVFVGGSTQWKLGEHAARFIREAQERGKLVHVGRCNSERRICYFASLGVDSFDGSGFSKWGDARIGLAVKWIDRGLAKAKYLSLFARV